MTDRSRPLPAAPRPTGANRPRILVSVRDAAEAEIAVRAGADLVDAKDPGRGALGALAVADVRAIAARVGGRVATSAVAGEAGADAPVGAVRAMAATGVDWVKVAVAHDAGDAVLAGMAAAAPDRLIAVLFAECGDPTGTVARLARAGFGGAMIDTRGKDGLRLADHLPPRVLAAFAEVCRAHALLCGLAGSLRVSDVPLLARHGADYLGFRGGLCVGSDRRDALDPARVAAAVAAARGTRRRDAA